MSKISVILVASMMAACNKEPTPPKPDTGRPETRSLEAADAIGYNGKEIRKKVDGALNANDAHNAELEKEMQQNQ
ncbi:hypothetical protein FK216_00870 [Moraxellaceae bacterium AER2_44_116]|nr:hypothetical protein [Moraxellaceae bacterium]TQC99831.1 hypothetical protein FK216_00870 [Moraxellaceae bacterium AER2_44_116]